MSAQPANPAQSAAEQPFPPPAVGWYATVILALLYWISVLDRFIISLLVDPIKRDLGMTDVQFGALQGAAFSISFTIFGLVFGALADRRSRRALIYAGVAIWSMATAACGFAQSFWHMQIARIGVGVGEAALNPNASSMIADLFPRKRLTTAMAVYGIGSTVGSGTALIIGGALVQMVSHLDIITLPLLGDIRPWQAVFFIVGVPGAVIGLLIFTVPEPIRRGPRIGRTGSFVHSYVDLFAFMRTRVRFFLCHYAGFTLAAAVVTGGVSWYSVHMMRSFGWSPGQVGFLLGPVLMVAGIVGKLACGWAVDYMYRRGYRDAQMRWYGTCMMIATPIGIFATMSGNPYVFLACITVFMTLIGAFQACAMTALNLVTPNELRGTGVAIFTTVSGMIGGSLGPMLAPTFSEYLFGGPDNIGLGMAALIGLCCPLGGFLLLQGLGAMRSAMHEVEQVAPE
jgi:MFS family permease